MRDETKNAFRFRRVKWGDPKHAMNALRNKEPVFVDDAAGPARFFWIAVAVLVIGTFGAIVVTGGTSHLLVWR